MPHALPEETNYGDVVEPIAIVGMACRFPGEARTVDQLWDMIVEGRNGHSKIPSSRFDANAYYHPSHERRGAINTKHGFFLADDISKFDASFFSITAKEVAAMDPLQRILLEVGYEAFENAGVPMTELPGSMTSVYSGCMTNDYELLSTHDNSYLGHNAASGNGRTMLANRLSWFFDLRGPSLMLDTACSSSLYALHLACQSIRLGESKMSLVTGSNLILHPNMMSRLSDMHMLSPEGISHSFDERANGYGRGEAVGCLVVKPLKDALADGNTIRAVIRGTGANQDGHTPGITMPSSAAQSDLLRATYTECGLDFKDTGYFEAHGTGTGLGDPTELSAIGGTLGIARDPEQVPLYVGSVKTNIGHTEGAAGVAGVIKAVLTLEKGIIPPNSGFETLNPKLRLDDWRLALPLTKTAWPSSGVRRASVFSFGFGGSNAHLIVDDAYHYLKSRNLNGKHITVAPTDDASDSGFSSSASSALGDASTSTTKKLFVFSSHDQGGLARNADAYHQFARERQEGPNSLAGKSSMDELLQNMAYTLAERRTKFDFRSFAIGSTLSELEKNLASGLPKFKRASTRHDNIIGIFTGQGAQWPRMGVELLENRVFLESMRTTQKYLESFGCPWNVIEELQKPKNESRVNQSLISQPICTAIQVALVDLARHWGLSFKAVAGHSSGEIGAAYAAGFLTHEDSIKIAYWRGVFSSEVNGRRNGAKGAMMAAGISEEEVRPYLDKVAEDSAVVACINSPSSVTLSGDIEAIDELERLLKADDKFARKLMVETAYHSLHMKVVAEDYLKSMATVNPLNEKSAVLMYSSVYSRPVQATELDAAYWVANLLSPVRFSDAIKGILTYSPTQKTKSRRKAMVNWTAMVEIGPHEALKGPANQTMTKIDSKLSQKISYTSMLMRGKPADDTALGAAGLLWCEGHSIDITKINFGGPKHGDAMILTDLPGYVWNHEKTFWHEATSMTYSRTQRGPRTDLLGMPVSNQNAQEPRWSNYLRLPENPWMADHEITGTVLYPGAGMLIMALEAIFQMADPTRVVKGFEFKGISFDRGLVIPASDQTVETSLTLSPCQELEDWYKFTVFSLPTGGSWTKHSWGMISLVYEGQQTISEEQVYLGSYEDIKNVSTNKIDIQKFYKDLSNLGMGYGSLFTNMTDAATPPGQTCGHGTIIIPDTKSSMPHEYEYPHVIHPATLDAIFHLLFIAFLEAGWMKEAAVPVSIEKMYLAAKQPQGAGSKFLGYSKTVSLDEREACADLTVSDQQWSEVKIAIEGFSVRKVSSSTTGASTKDIQKCGVIRWSEDAQQLRSDDGVATIKAMSQDASSFEQLRTWLNRACFKSSGLKVLLAGDVLSDDYHSLVKEFAPKAEDRFRFNQLVAAVATEDQAESLKEVTSKEALALSFVVDEEGDEKKTETAALDLIVAIPRNGELSYTLANLEKFTSKLEDGGRLAIAAKENTTDVDAAITKLGFNDKTLCSMNGNDLFVVFRKCDEANSIIGDNRIVLIERQSPSPAAVALKGLLTEILEAKGFKVSSMVLSEAAKVKNFAAISLLECDEPLVIDWAESDFYDFKKLVAQASYLMWITRGGQMQSSSALEYGPTVGLLRTVRTEVMTIALPHVDLSPAMNISEPQTAELIYACLAASTAEGDTSREMEYVIADRKILIPRIEASPLFDKELEIRTGIFKPVAAPLFQGKRPLRVTKTDETGVKNLHWADDSDAVTPLSADEVQFQPSHVSVTDLNGLTGMTSGSHGPCYEAVGTLIGLGSGVTNLRVGQTVVALCSNNLKTLIRQNVSLVQPVPNHVSLNHAASLPMPLITAYYGLFELSNLRRNETILIQNAASDTGSALIRLAQFVGANIFVAVDSEIDKTYLTKTHGLTEENILFSSDRSLKYQFQKLTAGKGADVVVGTSSGELFAQCYSCLADFGGRFLNLTKNAGPLDLGDRLKSNVSFVNIDIFALAKARGSTISGLFSKVMELMKLGIFEGLPMPEVRSISKLSEALESAANKGSARRMIFTLGTTDIVPSLPLKPKELEMDPSATYVISGGLGALGLTLADMMVEHGARHLIFLSRSGPRTSEQHESLDSLRRRGCNVEVAKCNVNSDADVQGFASSSLSKGYKIKGVVQCAMVLRDSVFENMTYENWEIATKPKIAGSWNLHKSLPEDMDFFILLSSIVSIIGNVAQANYAAGNSYQDALAHYRHQRGLAATSLNVGLVSDASHFTDEYTIDDYLTKFGHMGGVLITEDQLNIVLKASMAGQTAYGDRIPQQLIAGIDADLQVDGKSANPWTKDPKFVHRIQMNTGLETTGRKNFLKLGLKNAVSIKDAGTVVESALRDLVADAMTAKPEDIDVEKPLQTFGIDSLKAVEVRGWIYREIAADVSVFDILSSMPLSELALRIAGKSGLISAQVAKEATGDTS